MKHIFLPSALEEGQDRSVAQHGGTEQFPAISKAAISNHDVASHRNAGKRIKKSRNFKCDICGKCFTKKYNVIRHKKTHLNFTGDVVESSPNKSQTANEVLVKEEPSGSDVDNLNESLDAIEEGAMNNSVGSLTEANGESIVLALLVIPKKKPYNYNDCWIDP